MAIDEFFYVHCKRSASHFFGDDLNDDYILSDEKMWKYRVLGFVFLLWITLFISIVLAHVYLTIVPSFFGVSQSFAVNIGSSFNIASGKSIPAYAGKQ